MSEVRRGTVALCSLGLVGVITSEAPVEVTYADGNKGTAWTGKQLAHRTFKSPFTGEEITVAPGGPWSSRNPTVLGYNPELL